MKTIKHLLLPCFLAVLTCCSDDVFAPQTEVTSAESNAVDYISMTVPGIEIADATTRSRFIDDGTELKFVWQENDAIGVVPMSGTPLYFPIQSENAQKNTAVFNGGDWALKTSSKYAAFFPINTKNQKTDIKHIVIDYTGQTQTNFMDYDFLATGAIQPKDGAVKFTMQRLSAILKIRVNVGANKHVRYFSLKAKYPVFEIKGNLDLSGTNPVYTAEVLSKSINTDLGTDFKSSGEDLMLYLMIPPTNLSGESLTIITNSDLGNAQEVTFTGMNFEAGKAYFIDAGVTYSSYIKNAQLISAAGLSDIAGSNGVNVLTNQERIMQVTKLNLSNTTDSKISDEIGFFRNLEELSCDKSTITSLDVSNNPALKKLNCNNTSLFSLDVSSNKALQELSCENDQLTSLDVSNNTLLEILSCGYNQLSSLDVSNNRALTELNCYWNQLYTLDVSNNPLKILTCSVNKLTSLDVSNNTLLTQLSCNGNQLTSLDVSNNSELKKLNCYGNKLISLNVSNNPNLQNLECNSNKLTSLDISSCTALKELAAGDNKFESLIIVGHSSLTWLSLGSNKDLTFLNCANNALKTLNVNNCNALTYLDCSMNYLTEITNFNTCTGLQQLYCFQNLMGTLNITSHTSLTKNNVYCGGQFTDENKTQYKLLTLTARAADTTSLRFTTTDTGNLNVSVVNQ